MSFCMEFEIIGLKETFSTKKIINGMLETSENVAWNTTWGIVHYIARLSVVRFTYSAALALLSYLILYLMKPTCFYLF